MNNCKTGLILLVSTILFSNCNAQRIAAVNVPDLVKESFRKEFPAVSDVKWEKEGLNFEAGFRQQGKTMSAVLDTLGKIIETETDIPVSELPSTVKRYIKLNYKGASIREAAVIRNAEGLVTYEAEVKQQDLLFNLNGEFIKAVKD